MLYLALLNTYMCVVTSQSALDAGITIIYVRDMASMSTEDFLSRMAIKFA